MGKGKKKREGRRKGKNKSQKERKGNRKRGGRKRKKERNGKEKEGERRDEKGKVMGKGRKNREEEGKGKEMGRRKSGLFQVRNKGKIPKKRGKLKDLYIGKKGKAFKIRIIGYIFIVIKFENVFTRSPLQRLSSHLKMPKTHQLQGAPPPNPCQALDPTR